VSTNVIASAAQLLPGYELVAVAAHSERQWPGVRLRRSEPFVGGTLRIVEREKESERRAFYSWLGISGHRNLTGAPASRGLTGNPDHQLFR